MANPWLPQTDVARRLRDLYQQGTKLGNERQADIQSLINDPSGVAERLAGTVGQYFQDPMNFAGGGMIRKVAPQAEALRLAQQRAALPVEQQGLGLHPNNTPQERAAAMEGKTGWLHGTQTDFEKFIPYPHQETGIAGTSITKNPDLASEYAIGVTRKNLEQQLDGRVMPLTVLGKHPVDYGDLVEFKLNRMKDQSNVGQTKAAKKFLEKEDSIGVDLRNYLDDEVSVLNPDRIRSRFAAFDPWRRNTAIAAMMGVAAPDLLAQERRPMSDLMNVRKD